MREVRRVAGKDTTIIFINKRYISCFENVGKHGLIKGDIS